MRQGRIRRSSRRWAPLLAVFIGALVLPAAAGAAPATNVVLGQVNNHLTASWDTPDDRISWVIEASDDLDLEDNGSFDSADYSDDLQPGQESYSTSRRLAGGRTYYVVVGVIDPEDEECNPVFSLDPCIEFSSPRLVVFPPDPGPPPASVSTTGGRITASWTLLPEMLTDGILVSLSPNVDARGRFLEQEITLGARLDSTVTSFTSSRVFAPGTYYVQVATYYDCFTCEEGLFSPPVPVTITAAQVNTSGAPGLDKATAFASLKTTKKQDVDKLVVSCSMAEAGTLSATGTVNVPGASKLYKFKKTSISATAGKTVRLKLKLSKKSLRAVKKALRRKKKLRASLTITARDNAGNTKVEKKKVSLKP